MPKCVQTLRYMAGWATKISGEHVEPSGLPTGTIHAYVRREPIGVAAQIVPWNFPLMMAVQKIAPAFAAGCTVILKPAEQTSLTALRLADLSPKRAFPAGVFNIVTGYGETAGDRLVRHADCRQGRLHRLDRGRQDHQPHRHRDAEARDAGAWRQVAGDRAARRRHHQDGAGAARSIFANSGQVCIAGSRLYAHRDIFDKLLEGGRRECRQASRSARASRPTR
jgi:phenylacetaldehyde dehydrogenase